jgi:hypothetical protein
LPSEAIIIAREGDQPTDRDKEVQAEQQLVALYTEGGNRAAGCRRQVLDKYLDRQEGREGCKDGEQKCNICRGAEAKINQSDKETETGEETVEEDDSRAHSDNVERGAAESKGKENQQIYQQQQHKRQGPQQAFIQQRQQEVSDVE